MDRISRRNVAWRVSRVPPPFSFLLLLFGRICKKGTYPEVTDLSTRNGKRQYRARLDPHAENSCEQPRLTLYRLHLSCTQPSYVAPEILKNQPYDQSCDMWSIGVILYVLLCGYTPFMEEDQEKMFERIKQGDWSFDERDWGHVSQDAKDLIGCMLTVDVNHRITAKQALRSKWIAQGDDVLSSRDLSQSQILIKEKRPSLAAVARAFMTMGVNTKTALKSINPVIGEEDEDANHLT